MSPSLHPNDLRHVNLDAKALLTTADHTHASLHGQRPLAVPMRRGEWLDHILDLQT